MYKDIVISFLGALLLEPVFKTTEVGEKIAMIMGVAAMLFIFCLFCEEQAEKMARKAPEGTNYGAEDSETERRWDA